MQTFPTGNYANIKLAAEVSLSTEDILQQSEPEAVNQAYQYAKELVNNAFKAMNPESYYNTGVISRDTYLHTEAEQKQEDRPIRNTIDALKEDILSCKDIKTLESYKLMVKAKPDLEIVYNARMSQLLNDKP